MSAVLFNGCARRVVDPDFLIAQEVKQVGGPYWHFNGIEFVNPNTGILLTDERYLYKTTDGGQTWSVIFTIPQGSISAFSFPHVDTLYVFTKPGSFADNDVQRSVDGGLTWSTVSQVADVVLPAFYNGKTGFAMSAIVPSNQIRLIKTTTAGASWTNVGSYNANTFKLRFITPLIGYTIDGQSQFLTSTDGGLNWANSGLRFRDIKKMNQDGSGYAYEYDRGLVKTTDYGATWSLILAESTNGVTFSDFDISGQTIVAIHDQNLIVSQDGGSTWNTYLVETDLNSYSFRLYQVYITDSSHVLLYERTGSASGDCLLLRVTL